MSDWHVNEGLAPLIGQFKAAHPGIVIGTIGDAAHQHEHSDHNPNAAGRVNAADIMLGSSFTEADANALIPFLTRDPRTHYVIHDRWIWESETGRWRRYTGDDPHTNHIHLSVKDSAHTDPRPWTITFNRKAPTMKLEVALPMLREGDDDATLAGPYMILRIQRIVGVSADGQWGPQTTAGIASWCKCSTADAKAMNETRWREILGLAG
jgi:hypothetical protein